MTWLKNITLTLAAVLTAGSASAETPDVVVAIASDAATQPAEDKPAEDKPEEWACSSDQMAATLEQVQPTLVSVEGRLDGALGFAFHDRRHVLTVFSAVFWAESIRVRLPDGHYEDARIVAVDADSDLAILALPGDLLPEPLALARPARVGDPLFAVGTTDWERTTPSIHAGVVNATTATRLHSDALDSSFFKLGAPLLACGGGLVGIARQGYGDEAIPIQRAVALATQIGAQPDYEGPAVRPHLEAGFIAHGGQDVAGGGVSLGLSLLGREGWEAKVGVGVLVIGDLTGEYMGGRLIGHTAFGYRGVLTDDLSLSANVGLSYVFDHLCRGNCSEGNPEYMRHRLMPTFEVGVQLWPATLSYQLMLDVENPDRSIHQVLLGVDF